MLVSEFVLRSAAAATTSEQRDTTARDQSSSPNWKKSTAFPPAHLLPSFRPLPKSSPKTAPPRFTNARRALTQLATSWKPNASLSKLPPRRKRHSRSTKARSSKALELAGWSAAARRDDRKAVAHLTDAAALTEKSRDPLEWLRVHFALAYGLYFLGEPAHAETLLRQVIALEEEKRGRDDPDTLVSRNNLASALLAQGKAADAEAEHRAILAARELVLGPEHPDTLASRVNVAGAMIAQGKFADVETEIRTVCTLADRVSGPDDPLALTSRHLLAVALVGQGRFADGLALYGELLAVLQRKLGLDHPDTLIIQYDFAIALVRQSRLTDAETELRTVLQARNAYSARTTPKQSPPAVPWPFSFCSRQKVPKPKRSFACCSPPTSVTLAPSTLAACDAAWDSPPPWRFRAVTPRLSPITASLSESPRGYSGPPNTLRHSPFVIS